MIQARLDALRRGMDALACDGFFSLSQPANQYLTGFIGTTSAVVVSRDAAIFLCDFRYTEQAGEQVSGFDIEEFTGSIVEAVAKRLNALGVTKAAFDPAVLTVADADDVDRHLQATLEPAPDIVKSIRLRKDPSEIAKIRAASELAEGVLLDVAAGLAEGTTEREAAAKLEFEFKRRGAFGPSFDTIALFGARSSLPHGMPGDAPLTPGDIVLFDLGCRMNGYCSDLTRTYAFGRIPGAWFEEIYELTRTAQQLALEAVRPGMSTRELDGVARNLIRDAGHGDHFGHGLGHGVGIEIHESPRLSPHMDTVLEPGMVVTVEPGVYLPGQGGVRIEDLVVVTETGCECLTTSSKRLQILGT